MAKQPEFKVGDYVRWSEYARDWLALNGYDLDSIMTVTEVEATVCKVKGPRGIVTHNGIYEFWAHKYFVKDNFMGDVMAALESEASNA